MVHQSQARQRSTPASVRGRKTGDSRTVMGGFFVAGVCA